MTPVRSSFDEKRLWLSLERLQVFGIGPTLLRENRRGEKEGNKFNGKASRFDQE
jgi:hypothetical protein